MEYFKRWDGFTREEAAELLTIFKRLPVTSPLGIADLTQLDMALTMTWRYPKCAILGAK